MEVTSTNIRLAVPLTMSRVIRSIQVKWLYPYTMFLLSSELKKAVGLVLLSRPGITTARQANITTVANRMTGFERANKQCNSRSTGTKLILAPSSMIRLIHERSRSRNIFFMQGLSDLSRSISLGLKPSRPSSYTLSQHLLTTAISIGVFPFSSGWLRSAPASWNFFKTYGKLLQAAQWIRGFFSGSTFPDQLSMLAPWMAQVSTLPSSIAPFSLSKSTYYLLQYIPAMSRGVCPRLVALLRMGSLCLTVDRYRGMQGELCEHMCASAEVPEVSICEWSLSFSSKKGTNRPQAFSSSRQTCLILFQNPGCPQKLL